MADDTVTILIGLGSNLDPEQHLPRAVGWLAERFAAVRVSTFYRTRPLGDAAQPPFVNGVAAALTNTPVPEVKACLRELEARAGRQRTADKYAPRTLDLDLLLYGALLAEAWQLPAPELLTRDFVLLPAAELLPQWRHPVLGRPLADLAAQRFPQPVSMLGPVTLHLPPRPGVFRS